jgi:integrase
MPRVTLTDSRVKTLQPPERGQQTYFDETTPGFGLRVAAGGTKAWVVVWHRGGRVRRMTLGRYPILGLADARVKAKAALAAVVVHGEDPAAKKRTDRQAPTFRDVVTEYLEKHAKPRKRSWRADERMLNRYCPSDWWPRKAQLITRRDIREVLDTVVTTKPIMANRLLACLRKAFNVAVQRDLVATSPCVAIERPAQERRRDRVLNADELRQVWLALEQEEAPTAALFKLMLLTAQRGGEVKAMRWEDIDLEVAVWTVPAAHAKNAQAHRVPLTPAAIAIIRQLRELGTDGPFIFPSPRGARHLTVLVKPTARIRKRSGVDFVPHDLRRTCASTLTSMGVSRLTVGKLLNHKSIDSVVTAVYDRYAYDREKREALVVWAARLEQIVSGATKTAKVLALRA